MKKIFDIIRNKQIQALPEEKIRQGLLLKMINELGYPNSLISIEVALKSLPCMQDVTDLDRRLDIICFGKNIHPDFDLYPLLIIECKAIKLDDKALRQVQGYNHFVKSYFFSIANGEYIKTFWYDANKKDYSSIDFLPSYQDLLNAVKLKS